MINYKLMPGNKGKDCPANGKDPLIECACDECDYLMCCIGNKWEELCQKCTDFSCPRNNKN